jgi:hypothetical protein
LAFRSCEASNQTSLQQGFQGRYVHVLVEEGILASNQTSLQQGFQGAAGPLAGRGAAHLGDAKAGPHNPLQLAAAVGETKKNQNSYNTYFKFKEDLNQC